MAISVYDINTYLKNDSTLQTLAGKTMNFFPVVATDNEQAPFVVYFYNPMVPNVNAFWLRDDYIRYSIFDTDVDRLFKISERIIDILSVGSCVARQDGITSNTVRIMASRQTGSSLSAPLEINGWYRMNLDFKITAVVK